MEVWISHHFHGPNCGDWPRVPLKIPGFPQARAGEELLRTEDVVKAIEADPRFAF